MIEKEYYRLDELAPLGVTASTIRYFIEQEKLHPAFFVSNSRYVIGAYLEGEFNGFAIADYQGLVSFPSRENNVLLKKGKVTSSTVKLLQHDKIVIRTNQYPFRIPWPNTYISGWQKWTLNQLNFDQIPAKCYPNERDSGMAMFSDFVGQIAKVSEMEEEKVKEVENKLMRGLPRRVLSSAGIDFHISEICVTHTDLVRLGIIKSAVTDGDAKQISNVAPSPTIIEESKRPIDKLLTRMLFKFPNEKPTRIWRMLQDDVLRSERLYDTDEILDEVGKDELYWFTESGEPERLKQKSFFNSLRNFRILYSLNES
ncbi:hypothetical protein ACO1PK_08380 [Alishewanella sp. d11]|uniref:hypothetical protein n=1 Tax=Alishewanella sp. d11 TaxID=3414030 RepID=UPI003BF834FC